jgi:hypothetical protein
LSDIEIADPFVLRADGKFYLYNTDTMPGEPRGPLHKQIVVVVADSPIGPFTDKGVLAPEVAWVGLGL